MSVCVCVSVGVCVGVCITCIHKSDDDDEEEEEEWKLGGTFYSDKCDVACASNTIYTCHVYAGYTHACYIRIYTHIYIHYRVHFIR